MAKIQPTLLLVLILLVGCQRGAVLEEKQTKVVGHNLPQDRVQLTIDFRDKRANTDFHLDWEPELTVFDVLLQVKDLSVVYTGSGETAFVKSIGGTEGGKGGNKWWLYDVNGKKANVGCGVYILKPNDKVTWRLGEYE